MAEVKWIKITTNMFDDEKIKLIDAMPERDTIFYIWMRLLVQAGKCNAGGYIFLSENVPYTDEMFSTIFNRPLNSVRLALKTLDDFGMIERSETNSLKITNWEKHQNVDGMEKVREQNRLRVAKHRAKQKKLKDPENEEKEDVTLQSRDSHAIEREREEERDIDKDIESKREEKETLSVDKKILEILKFYEQKTSASISSQYESVKSLCEVYEPKDIKEALEKSIERNKKGVAAINYSKGILKNWATEGKPKEEDNHIQKNATKGHFNDYEQRKYDFDDLEKKLLGWDNK